MNRRLVASVIFAVVLVGGCGGSTATAPAGEFSLVPPATAAEVIEDQPGAVVLDVRTPAEFAEGHLAGAVNIDFYATDFTAQLDLLDRDTEYVVYCRSGNRSATAVEQMQELGFTAVTEIEGGIVNWAHSGFPTER